MRGVKVSESSNRFGESFDVSGSKDSRVFGVDRRFLARVFFLYHVEYDQLMRLASMEKDRLTDIRGEANGEDLRQLNVSTHES